MDRKAKKKAVEEGKAVEVSGAEEVEEEDYIDVDDDDGRVLRMTRIMVFLKLN